MKLGIVPRQQQVLSSCQSPCTGISCISGIGNCWDGSFPLSWNMALPWLLLDENLPGKNKAEPDQLVELHFSQNTSILLMKEVCVQLSPLGLSWPVL